MVPNTILTHELIGITVKTASRTAAPPFSRLYGGQAKRPKILTRKPWGGRKARCRGSERNLTDLLTRAGVVNLANLARKGLRFGPTGWAIA